MVEVVVVVGLGSGGGGGTCLPALWVCGETQRVGRRETGGDCIPLCLQLCKDHGVPTGYQPPPPPPPHCYYLPHPL